jgi:hypothetical protein
MKELVTRNPPPPVGIRFVAGDVVWTCPYDGVELRREGMDV